MKSLVSPAEALAIILRNVAPMETEIVTHEAALNRTLAREIVAQENLPPFDNSAMDGFAVIAADLKNAPAKLELLETIGAGEVAKQVVSHGKCLKIMTGAPLPDGADCVVMREETREIGEQIEFLEIAKIGQNIRRAGEDVSRGETILEAGTAIRAAQWAMLASLGQSAIEVFRRPRVAIVATGAELVDVDQKLEGGQIRDSNSFALRALALDCDAEIAFIKRVGDSIEELTAILDELAPDCDTIITSGGVSMGDFDPVRDVLKNRATVHFWKIAMKPGKPVMFAHYKNSPVFGLPGNPVSVMVAFEEFVRPALLKMSGRRALKRPEIEATIDAPLRSPQGKTEFVRAFVAPENGVWRAKIAGEQGSGRLSTMVRANALLVIGPETTELKVGQSVSARLINCAEVE